MKLRTTYDGRKVLRRQLWEIVHQQAGVAACRERDWFRPSLVATVFAFHTVEEYLNFVGERLAPQLWADERNYTKEDPYRLANSFQQEIRSAGSGLSSGRVRSMDEVSAASTTRDAFQMVADYNFWDRSDALGGNRLIWRDELYRGPTAA